MHIYIKCEPMRYSKGAMKNREELKTYGKAQQYDTFIFIYLFTYIFKHISTIFLSCFQDELQSVSCMYFSHCRRQKILELLISTCTSRATIAVNEIYLVYHVNVVSKVDDD